MRSSRPPLAPALTLLLLASLLSAAPTLGGDGASADADAFDGTADARVGARGRLDAALRALFPDGPPDSRGDGAGASAVYAAPPVASARSATSPSASSRSRDGSSSRPWAPPPPPGMTPPIATARRRRAPPRGWAPSSFAASTGAGAAW